ncbi:unnamed protein product [Didymodactylos carnosus]|uniref:Uncharacterized protein n=1 Tax=Didymodactylos carnosus TaxID=1234261 RepID=A0A814R7Q0_9BILA|nr:unnamed protein product [Didymodactylos carnosus]CAF1129335.1 unnamed protein product [Didymodactylos carnosus]CAF3874919.1 unnamed protein product [Didymodactylos carnosus]CAF3893015.1 unnamed protein product [Didymodactylos carnosus]
MEALHNPRRATTFYVAHFEDQNISNCAFDDDKEHASDFINISKSNCARKEEKEREKRIASDPVNFELFTH